MKLRDFKIDNNEKMTLMGGMNVLESRDLAMEVAEKFKNVTDKNDINYILKALLTKLTGALLIHSGGLVWMKA